MYLENAIRPFKLKLPITCIFSIPLLIWRLFNMDSFEKKIKQKGFGHANISDNTVYTT